ncbi:MAG: DNA repair protein RecN [Chitinophagales bacterium]|nr:DNA repair protein RecN [Chitinophagales bacterium]
MLHKLSVRNYAIIDKLEIDFSEKLNIITGETGAGKSILMGALGLILGERADAKVLYNQEEKCVVEADFDVTSHSLKSFFEENQLDYEPHTIIRREINQNGKSRAFVNDTPVNLALLKQLGEQLVNLHNQHETLELTKAGFQLYVVDALAKNKRLLQQYRQKFLHYKYLEKRAAQLAEQNKAATAETDFLNFQLSEFIEARLVANEQKHLEQEQSALSNVEDIKQVLQSVSALLEGMESGVLSQLSAAQAQLKTIKNFSPSLSELNERLNQVVVEVKDLAKEFERLQENTSSDPLRLDEVNARLTVIYRLLKKHHVTTIEDLLLIQADLELRLQNADNNTVELQKVQAEITALKKELMHLATELHSAREKVLREFQNHVTVLLNKVGMPGATFKVHIAKEELLSNSGFSQIRFLFSANKGFAPQEIKEVASGGELSRLMLCIKSLIAGAGAMPTLIFDEIDSGISGEVALKVGEIMKNLSRQHQLICITHLPQIARGADKHLYIYKDNQTTRTYTRIRELKGEERITELAKMLSGDKPTEAALANARELILN